MDLELTAEQVALREGARALLARECQPAAVRELVEKGRMPERLWTAQVDTGWSGLALPEDVGGLGLTAVEVAIVAEEAGRAIAPWAVACHRDAVRRCRSPRQRPVSNSLSC